MRPFDELSDRTHYAACSVVENTTPQGNAAAAYLCIRCTTGPTLLLTESEFALARSRAQVNPEDVPAWRDLVGEPKPSPNEDEPAVVPRTRCGEGCCDFRQRGSERVCLLCIEREGNEAGLRVAALQDLCCQVLATLEDDPIMHAIGKARRLLNAALEDGELTLDWGRLGVLAAHAAAQDEQADLLEALALYLEVHGGGMPGSQTAALAEDLGGRASAPDVARWLRRLFVAIGEHNPAMGLCRLCGCTDDDCSGCIERTGEPCAWADAEHTLCTACRDEVTP